MQDPQRPDRPTIHSAVFLAALLLLAAALRCGAIGARWSRLSEDPDAYRLIAENLAQHGVFSCTRDVEPRQPTAFRPPLYPLLLGAAAWHGQVTPAAVAVLHVLAGTLTVLLVWLLGQRCGLGRTSYLAALLIAADPILLYQSSEVMTETVATLLCALALLALVEWSRRRSCMWALLAGAILGLAVLCRPTFLVWAVLCGTYMLAAEQRSSRQRSSRQRSSKRVAQAAAFAAALCLILAPWGLRNQRVFGRAIVTTTHGGYTLLLGNNAHFYAYLRSGTWGSVWDARELQQMISADLAAHPVASPPSAAEIESDRRLYDLAKQTIRQQPGMFVYASLVRIGYLWSPLAHRVDPQEQRVVTWMRWGAAAWYVVVFAMAVAGAVRLRGALLRTPWVWGMLCVLAVMAVHSVYWTNMRMRAPLMPIIALVAASSRREEVEKSEES